MATKPLGEFEIVVLAAVQHLRDEAYGAAIREDIARRGGRRASVGAIYTTLARLEQKRMVTSAVAASTSVRVGRPKRYFRLTAKGRTAFEQSVSSLAGMVAGLNVWPDP